MQKVENANAIVYNDGEIELDVSVNQETLWLTQKQLALLFAVEVHTVNYHIKNIFKQQELDKLSTIRKIRIVQKEGKREISRDVEHYNLDMVISVGYRINSLRATKFRQWATAVLKAYIDNGYAINSEKITHQRFKELEHEVASLKQKVDKIDSLVVDDRLETKQGIFFDGQVFDAYAFMSGLIKEAKESIVLIGHLRKLPANLRGLLRHEIFFVFSAGLAIAKSR